MARPPPFWVEQASGLLRRASRALWARKPERTGNRRQAPEIPVSNTSASLPRRLETKAAREGSPRAACQVVSSLTSVVLRLLLLARRFVGGVKGVLQRHQVFARFERIQNGLLGLELLGGVSGGLD